MCVHNEKNQDLVCFFTADEIKKRYLIEKDKLELFRDEVINLAKYIKIWLAIVI